MATKTELEKEVRSLKSEIRELRKSSKAATGNLESLPFSGVGIAKDNDGKYNLVKLKFNLENNSAAVEDVFKIVKGRSDAAIYSRNAIVDEVIKLSKENV